ncbi:MAG TPA: hypothetical protein VKM94_03845, partial [Blastocatellia bacterium]|nr:hypothetical protein [Blastocatellia bacterium]
EGMFLSLVVSINRALLAEGMFLSLVVSINRALLAEGMFLSLVVSIDRALLAEGMFLSLVVSINRPLLSEGHSVYNTRFDQNGASRGRHSCLIHVRHRSLSLSRRCGARAAAALISIATITPKTSTFIGIPVVGFVFSGS